MNIFDATNTESSATPIANTKILNKPTAKVKPALGQKTKVTQVDIINSKRMQEMSDKEVETEMNKIVVEHSKNVSLESERARQVNNKTSNIDNILEKSIMDGSQNPLIEKEDPLYVNVLNYQLTENDLKQNNNNKSGWGNAGSSKIAKKPKEDTGKNQKLAGIEDFEEYDKSNQKASNISMEESAMSIGEMQSDVSMMDGASMSMFGNDENKDDQHVDLRKTYLSKFGVEMSVPAYYIQQAQIVPHKRDLVVILAYHVLPMQFESNIQTTFINGEVEDDQDFNDLEKMSGKHLIIKLEKAMGRNGFQTISQFQMFEVQNAKIKFSESGQWFGIFLPDKRLLRVFKSTDIEGCFKDIQNEKCFFEAHVKDEEFQGSRIVFGRKEKVVAIYSQTTVIAYNLTKPESDPFKYSIDEMVYSTIHDVAIDSSGCEWPNFKSVVAIKLQGVTNIHCLNIGTGEIVSSIFYVKKLPNIHVQISEKMDKVLFSNGEEHYIIKGKNQDIIDHLKNKFIRHSINYDNSFYLMTTKDYDRDVDIIHAERTNVKCFYDRKIEPGLMQVLDSNIIKKCLNKDKSQDLLQTLMKIGDYLYLDSVNVQLCDVLDKTAKRQWSMIGTALSSPKQDPQKIGNQKFETDSDHSRVTERENKFHLNTSIYKYYSATTFNWPYFAFANKQNWIFIYNAFNPKFIQRYELPSNISIVSSTFLTDTHDLFIIAETKEEFFEIFQINLDSNDPRVQSLFKYPFSKVNRGQVVSFHVRGSSVKEKINLNKALMCFMLHNENLYVWRGKNFLEKIDQDADNMYYLSDDVFFYKTTKQINVHNHEVEQSVIYMIEAQFGNYEKTQIYKDTDIMQEILNFGVDNTRQRLLILSGKKNLKNKRDKFITIFDIKTEKILYSMQIFDREIIGRLKSNLYNFVEGHIYYGNKVIKIRYDLIEIFKGQEIKENQLFDYYSDILSLKHPSDEIQSGTPLQTCLYNRLAYVVRNPKKKKPFKVMILPYLHERRIYLNRRHTTNQFYTIFTHHDKDFIFCFAFADSKIYIYTETGKLINRILYNDISEKCGKPISISEDARYMIFKQSSVSQEINLINVTFEGLVHLKTIHLQNAMSSQINQYGKQNLDHDIMHQFFEHFLENLDHLKNIDIKVSLNDNGDVLVRLKPKDFYLKARRAQLTEIQDNFDMGEAEVTDEIDQCSLFFFEGNMMTGNSTKYLYYDSPVNEISNMKGVSMNKNFIFFWNPGTVWKLDLKTKKLDKLSIYVSEKETRTFIRSVRTSSNPDFVSIRIEQSPEEHCIVIWDLLKNIEIESFDVNHNAYFFQDKLGNPQIVDKDYLINCKNSSCTKSYSFQVSDFNFENCTFGLQYGIRMENKTQNWVILRNFINLSFSYMTFVIKENFDGFGFVNQDFVFDLEGYDYILNGNNMFTEGSLVKTQFEKMQFILQNYQDLDPILLQSLHFKNNDGKLPLHIALAANNNRMVNLIVQYMSKIDITAIKHFKDVLSELVSYHSMEEYLVEAPFNTIQMINKQTIMLDSTEEEDIVVTGSSCCSYIDDEYFTNTMGDMGEVTDSTAVTHSVNFRAIRADFIINDKAGYEFLKEMLKQKRMCMFETPYMMLLTQFLYKNFSKKIMKMLLPSYIVHQISAFCYIILAEHIRDKFKIHELGGHDDEFGTSIQSLKVARVLMGVFMLLAISVNVYFFYRQTLSLGLRVLGRLWSFIDLVVIILNSLIIINIFFVGGDDLATVRRERLTEALLMICLWFKSLYYLGLVGEIAPLIDIIFVIISDIRFFIVVYIITMIGFINAYYLIGKNQLDLGAKPDDLAYGTWFGAIMHVYKSSQGDFDDGAYYGDEMWPFHLFLYFSLNFFMSLTLLNMLIAIMGETFGANQEIAESKKRYSQLQFVVENWWIDPIPNKENLIYIIGAFEIKDDHEGDERLDDIIKLVNENKRDTDKKLDRLLVGIQSLESQIRAQDAEDDQEDLLSYEAKQQSKALTPAK